MKTDYDVIIIGGGPGGYTSAIYCARSSLKTLIIEETHAGGQISSTGNVDYPGFEDGIEGSRLLEKMRTDAENHGAKTLFAKVYSLNLEKREKTVFTTKGDFKCRSVILAMGASPRRLGLPGESALSGRGVNYYISERDDFYKGKTAAVIGGGSAALDNAVILSDICKKVYLIHEGGGFKADDSLINDVLRRSNIVVLYHTEISGLLSEDGVVTGLSLTDKTSGRKGVIDCNGIFVAIGKTPNTRLLRFHLKTDKDGYVIADETTRTNIDGVFATGDLRTKPLRQIITAASDGAVAAMNAKEYIRRN